MNSKMQNPGVQNRGFTISESLNLLKKSLPQPDGPVNGNCSDCYYFRQVEKTRGKYRGQRNLCQLSGEVVSPDGRCEFWRARGVEKC